MAQTREFDLVVVGATGFTGSLVVDHLKEFAPADLKWAIAGRREQPLKEKVQGTSIGVIICDAMDEEQNNTLAQRTKVVLTLAGPYTKYGRALVAACARYGTDYADITGETGVFVSDMIKQHHEIAMGSGARILHCCGFDSVPADLLARKAVVEMEKADPQAKGYVVTSACDAEFSKGTASGGTLASIITMFEYFKENREKFAESQNPYALGGAPEGWNRSQWSSLPDETIPRYCTELRSWCCPFIMAMCNTRIVRRSMSGKNVIYRELQAHQGPMGLTKCLMVCFFLIFFMALMLIPPFRKFLAWIRPPGSGPTLEERENGQWREIIAARSAYDQAKPTFMHGFAEAWNQDPGYKSTSIMAAQTALSLVTTRASGSSIFGGIQTPASAVGEVLEDRLATHGITFKIESKLSDPGTNALLHSEFWIGISVLLLLLFVFYYSCSSIGLIYTVVLIILARIAAMTVQSKLKVESIALKDE